MHTSFFRAHTRLLVALLALAGALSLLGSLAQATSWMAFSEGVPPTGGISNDSQHPTILSQVTVVCPAAGFLVATSSSTAFLRNLTGTQTTGSVVFSISREMRRDEVYDTVVVLNLGPNTFANIPANVQRIEACNAGETRTYFHTVHGAIGPGNQVSTEGVSRLVVEFFDQPL